MIVCRTKTNVSSSAGSVCLFLTTFLPPHLEDGRRYPLSAIQHTKTYLDRRVVLLHFPRREEEQELGSVAGLVVGTDLKCCLQLRNHKHLYVLIPNKAGGNRQMFLTLSCIRFWQHQKLFCHLKFYAAIDFLFQLYRPFQTIQRYLLDSVCGQDGVLVYFNCSLHCLF
jgi:hypothetical protein